MPDANPEATASALIGASMGAAGQRCMAISAAVFVGGMGKYKDALISKAKALKVFCTLCRFVIGHNLVLVRQTLVISCPSC